MMIKFIKLLLQKRKYRKELLAEAYRLQSSILQEYDTKLYAECVRDIDDIVKAYNVLFNNNFDRDIQKYRLKKSKYFDKLCKRYDNIGDICDKYQN